MLADVVKILDVNIQDENKPLFLIEFHGDKVSTVAYGQSGKEYDMHGLKIYRIIDRHCEILSKYDQVTDSIDTSPLAIKDAMVVFVASEDGKTLHWYKANIMAWDHDKREFAMSKYIECSDSDVEYLEAIYPKYFEKCTLE